MDIKFLKTGNWIWSENHMGQRGFWLCEILMNVRYGMCGISGLRTQPFQITGIEMWGTQ